MGAQDPVPLTFGYRLTRFLQKVMIGKLGTSSPVLLIGPIRR